MNIIADRGNSITKIYLFAEDELSSKIEHDSLHLDSLIIPHEWNLANESMNLFVSDVGEGDPDWSAIIPVNGKTLRMDHALILNIEILYQTPETLGHDRIANACAVSTINRGKDSLVIDAGTCLKFDIVKAGTTYLGGSISPGLKMRYEAVANNTSQLPHLKAVEEKIELIGTSTTLAIQSGIQNGMIEEINGITERYRSMYPGISVYLTGGDTEVFATMLKSPIFVAPDLTARGLNEIFKLNLH